MTTVTWTWTRTGTAIAWLAMLAGFAMAADNAAPAKADAALKVEESGKTEPAAPDQGHQLRTLGAAPKGGRFEVTDRVWPAQPGGAAVCLWDGDRLAAVSVTIDDNWTPDHEWWMAQGEKLGFRFTWFAITGRVGTGGLWGTWDKFKKLHDAGHDVQSHTVTHLHVDEPGWKGVEWEYSESVRQIESDIPGNKVVCLAYPGGGNSKLNSQELAAKYYIAARGTVGRPNKPNLINYMQTNSMSLSKEWIDAILGEVDDRGHKQYWRSWMCTHYHGLHNTRLSQEEQDAFVKKVSDNLAYIKSREADLWFGLFREVAQYGQERDTAKLTVTKNTSGEIRLALTDDMSDELFDFPLTVKVRLPDAWAETIEAKQGNKAVEAKVVSHDGARFALVRAIPDKGEIVLTPSP